MVSEELRKKPFFFAPGTTLDPPLAPTVCGLKTSWQVVRFPPKSMHVVPQNTHFWPKTVLTPSQNGPTKGNGGVKLGGNPPPTPTHQSCSFCARKQVCLDLPVPTSPLLPSNCTICPRKGPQMAKNGADYVMYALNSPKPKNDILGYVAQFRIPRAPSPPTSPHFLWFFRVSGTKKRIFQICSHTT